MPGRTLRPYRDVSKDEGRHLYRSLDSFHETEVVWFHRPLSLTMPVAVMYFSAGGPITWWGTPGEWLLVIAAGMIVVLGGSTFATILRSPAGGTRTPPGKK